jgi:hypothetical protein
MDPFLQCQIIQLLRSHWAPRRVFAGFPAIFAAFRAIFAGFLGMLRCVYGVSRCFAVISKAARHEQRQGIGRDVRHPRPGIVIDRFDAMFLMGFGDT